MSTTAEIIAKLEAEAFDAEETARLWGGESQCAPPLRAAAARLDELERENARLRAALEPFVKWHRIRETQGGLTGAPNHPDDTPIFMAASIAGEQCITIGDLRRAAALTGSGEK
jgi:hypothetical protein